MRASEILHRQVVDLETADALGRVEDLVVDPDRREVVSLVVGTQVIRWGDLHAAGRDVVTVDRASALRAPGDDEASTSLRDRSAGLLGRRVLSEHGDERGQLADLEVDDDGRIRSIIASTGTIGGESLCGIGSYAVVVGEPDRPVAG